MNYTFKSFCAALLLGTGASLAASGQIINHHHTVLNSIPLTAIAAAKDSLHIAYGHTSHGSQLLSGNGAGSFGLNKLRDVDNVFVTSATGVDGTLHLVEGSGYDEGGDLSLDAGYLTADEDSLSFIGKTIAYLGKANAQGRGANHPEINVVMWSWCGQLSRLSASQVDWYLQGMADLEESYPGVTFVYMTGHLDGTGANGTLHLNNERIRAFVRANDKWLYDFADIESYDPDGKYYLDLDADDNADSDKGNWAKIWTAAHPDLVNSEIITEHSQPLVGQLKTTAAWWLYCALSGWSAPTSTIQRTDASTPLQPFHTRTWDLLGRTP